MLILSKDKNNYQEYGNIRPRAILPTKFKIFEFIILQRIKMQYQTTLKTLHKSQLGFHSKNETLKNIKDIYKYIV